MEGRWIEGNKMMEFINNPAVTETFVDILVCAVPIWVAVTIGLVIGWSWRPRWTGLIFLGFRSKLRFMWTAPPGFGARRFWLAFTAVSAFPVCRRLWFSFRGRSRKEEALTREQAGSGSVSGPTLVAASLETDAAADASSGEIR